MSPHALITGAASGIGAAVTEDLASRGWHVTATDMQAVGLARLRSEVKQSSGTTVALYEGDLADPTFVRRLVHEVWETCPVDALVNAAGIYPARPLLDMTAEAWDRVQTVNVRAPVLATVELAKHAVANGVTASIVNITSGASRRARPGAAHYCTSKAALTMATKACAVELGPHGIRVNALSPGFVRVDSEANPVTAEYAATVSSNPLGRTGVPADLLGAVRFLLSEEASWTTGAVLDVDGGSAAGTTELPVHWQGESLVQQSDPQQAESGYRPPRQTKGEQ